MKLVDAAGELRELLRLAEAARVRERVGAVADVEVERADGLEVVGRLGDEDLADRLAGLFGESPGAA